MGEERAVRILYTNYRGETNLRRIVPERIHFGSTEWHPEPQWLMEALDVEKNATRSFAMKDIRAWIATE
jgi:predicted DNA-binding transcriptional regulator YafY